MQPMYALSATAFFLAFVAIVAVYGGETARYLVAIAAFLGALSQFVAQDDGRVKGATQFSIGLAWAAIAMGVASLVWWS